MNIAVISQAYPPFSMGGIEVYAAKLAGEFAHTDNIFVFTAVRNRNQPPNYQETIQEGNILIRTINRPGIYSRVSDIFIDPHVDQAFEEFLRWSQADIIHVHHLRHLSNNIILKTKKKYKIPIVYTIHMPWLFDVDIYNLEDGVKTTASELSYYKKQLDLVSHAIDAFLTPSKFMKMKALQAGIPEKKIYHLPFGFDRNLIKYKKKRYQTDSQITFGFMGRVSEEKGVDFLIQAFSKMKHKTAKLKIHGTLNPSTEHIRNIKTENIHYEGAYSQEEISNILNEIDVMVVPSLTIENYPIVIQEAIMGGICTIASNLGGVRELIQDGENGFLFEPKERASLIMLMNNIADEPTILNSVKPTENQLPTTYHHTESIRKIFKNLITCSKN